MVQKYFDGNEFSLRIDPDQAVVCGAAIQAANSSGMSNNLPNLMAQEVILTADQIQLPLKACDGEKTKIQDNNLLGGLEPIKHAISFPPSSIITVRFNVNENGIFTISAENWTADSRK
ncbi:hypothetical protein MRB53_029497 [Persea americana]|uniref:Uncharacterized protein n=1 Tax=Persea americana TaxID=3435 RepID=A0ACC2KJ65_PERAE|nr:hypothetical protein MRB53_029497 [Persea americana]